jgi:biotin transport system substrate-specific component
MADISVNPVLADLVGPRDGSAVWVKRAFLVIVGVIALALAAKLKVALPGTPVPISMGTFAVLSIGAAYGLRLGLVTLLAYMVIGLMGQDVFAGSDPDNAAKIGLTYMMGGTGGYLVGYVLAGGVLGYLARLGWDRSVIWMAVAMLIGNLIIYVPGLLWLNQFAESWAQTLEWGLTPFLIGDALKLALAAVLLPALWKLVGSARG